MFKFKDKTDQYLDSIHELNVQIRDLKHKVNVLEIELKHRKEIQTQQNDFLRYLKILTTTRGEKND
tara:strand:- start:2560 stop:2757 length:198 start_codon:yes stop_codon:yes gene_type:complete